MQTVKSASVLWLAVALCPTAFGGDRQFLPKDDAVVVEVRRPMDLWNHALVKSLRTGLEKSSQFQSLKTTPQFDRLNLLRQLIEQGTGGSWDDGLRKLTAGGVVLSFSPGKNYGLTVVGAAADAKTLARFLAASRRFVRSRLPQPQRSAALAVQTRDGVQFVRLGKAAYAVVGRRFVFGSSETRMWNAVNAIRRGKSKSAAHAESRSGPFVKVTVNAAAVRELPPLQKALKLPAANAGLTALVGGWLDLLRHSGTITAELSAVGGSLEIRVRSDVKHETMTAGLRGYFADGRKQKVAPPLQLPDMIYSASWFRDYRSLWNGRAQLLAAGPLKKLEEGEKTLRQQLAVIGGKVLPSRAFSLLGPHFRVVAVRQKRIEYDVDSANRVAAAGLVVDLRDEKAFRVEVVPLFRAVTLLLTVTEAKMLPRKSTYKGTELTSIRFRADPQAVRSANRLRFSFAPTYAVTRGHLVVGSTRTMVEQLIDELDRQSRNRKTADTTATEIQRFSLSEAAAAVGDVQSLAILQQAFGGGLSVSEAKDELKVLQQILQTIGTVATQAGFTKDGFEYRVRIGPHGD